MTMEYLVEVLEVRSGDDLVVLADLGIDDLYKKVRCRLRGVDTPDAYKASPDTEAGQVRSEVRRLTRDHKCKVYVNSKTRNGWIVDLILLPKDEIPVSLNELLISRGYVYRGLDNGRQAA